MPHPAGVHQDLPRPAAARHAPANAGPPWPRSTCATTAGSPTSPANSPDGTSLPLCRLRYGGYANRWGFAIYLASKDGYEDSVLPSGYPVGTAEEALDCACGLYLNDPTAWRPSNPRRTSAQDHLVAMRVAVGGSWSTEGRTR